MEHTGILYSGKENRSSKCVKYTDVGKTLFHYVSDIGKSHMKPLESGSQNCNDGQICTGMVITDEDEARRLLVALSYFHDICDMFETRGSEIVKIFDSEGNTLLSRAAKDGNEDLVILLLKYGADVNHLNNDDNTPLMLALECMHEAIVFSLLLSGAEINCVNKKFETPLKLAASSGNVEITNCLLRAGANPNHISIPGDTALNRACKGGNALVVQALLDAGADVNSENNIYANGLSPLMLTAKRHQLTIVDALLRAGVDINGIDGYYDAEDTPLFHATKESLLEIMHIFILAGADVNHQNSLGQSALSMAIRYGRNEAAKCLLAHNADINQRTKSGDTPLILAAEIGNATLCKMFLNNGANVHTVNDHDDTALIQASRTGHVEAMRVLVDAGADLNHVNKSRMSALRFAVTQSLFDCSPCLTFLLECDVLIHSELHYAVTLGFTHVVKKFLANKAMPQPIKSSCLTFMPLLPPMTDISPLYMALITDQMDIVKHFMDLVFLTDFDLKVLQGIASPTLKRHLQQHGKCSPLRFLKHQLPIPLTLHSLSLVAVSKSVGFDPRTRQARIAGTGLPPLLQRKLMFML